jgi:MFS family permease
MTTISPARTARRVLQRTFSSLHVRNFRLFFIGQTVSNTGNWLTTVALVLLVLHLTSSGFAVGLLTACQFGPIMFFSIWAGSIADRSNKRNLLFITQSLEMAQSVTLAVLAFTPHPPLAALYVVAAIGGTLLAFDNPLRRSFVTEMVPPDEVPNAVALYSAIVNTSRVFGPALAGLLVVTVGFGWCFTIDAVSYITVLVALYLMRPAELRRLPSRPKQKGDIRAAFRYIARLPHLRISFILLAVIGILGYNFNVVLPLFVEQGLHEGDGAFTFVYAVFSAGALVSALVVANRHLVRMRHILVGAATFGGAMLALTFAPTLAVAVPIVFAVGLTSILYMTSSTAIVQVEADQAMHGRLLALQTVLFVGTAPIGGPLLGWLSDAFGPRAPVLLGAVATLAAAAWGGWALRRTDRHGASAMVPLAEGRVGPAAEVTTSSG